MQKLQHMLEEKGEEMVEVRTWSRVVGAAPGGTFQTVWSILEGKAIPPPDMHIDLIRRAPDGTKSESRVKTDLTLMPRKCLSPWDKDSPRWSAFFVMSGCNAAVIRWGQSLRSKVGRETLIYHEAFVLPNWESSLLYYAGLYCFITAALNPVAAYLLRRCILSKSGEGPSMDGMEQKNWCLVSAKGIGEKGSRALSHMYFAKDTGCLETSRILTESTLALALDEEKLPAEGGLWSPSAALGDLLLERLVRTGTTYSAKYS